MRSVGVGGQERRLVSGCPLRTPVPHHPTKPIATARPFHSLGPSVLGHGRIGCWEKALFCQKGKKPATLVAGSAVTTTHRTGAGDAATAARMRSSNSSALAKNTGAFQRNRTRAGMR